MTDYISESGLIKIPRQLLDGVKNEAHLLFLSYAYHTTRLDSTVAKYHNLILKMLEYYNLTPIDNHLLSNEFVINFDDSDLPKSYRKYERPDKAKTVLVKIDKVRLNTYGYYLAPNTICLCTSRLYRLLRDPKVDEDLILEAFKNIDGTIDHELTHFIQKNYLHPYNQKMLPDYSKIGDDYYNSPVEFDPTIKSDLIWFAEVAYKLPPSQINDAIKYWIGSTYRIEYPFRPSNFFRSLRKNNPDQYLKAVKIFVSKAKEAVRDYVIEHTKITELQAKRLDTVFEDLRINEFADFVKNVNTFIVYPESRLQDFESIKKYLPKISDNYKQQDTKKLLFVKCGEQGIDMIVNQKKSFKIETIFSNPVVEGTGLLFEFGDIPVILNINILTRDTAYINACEEYGIVHLEGNFVIADGKNFKFNHSNLLGVYRDGKLVGK